MVIVSSSERCTCEGNDEVLISDEEKNERVYKLTFNILQAGRCIPHRGA